MRWVGHVKLMGEKKGIYRIYWGNLRGRDHLEDTGVDGSVILRGMFRKWDVGVWIGLIWLRIWTVGVYLCVR